ncbi:MAG: beta-glucosidase BglX [Prevotellaceae bacterium]|nr:beta-glucosidase BglX [Prevotellaceae bacterium]MDY3365649.1 beta-glucosidase BglX [Prevotella sp.]
MALFSTAATPPKTDMKTFIDDLMGKMTLEEKIGQLNLPVSGDIVTGQAKSSNVAEKIKKGQVGGLFNLKGAAQIREIQKVAVEQSRLKIPLIFGMDVIHGYETIFPIPLSLSWTWNMDAIRQSARIAAQEATADGIAWTFSPMLDISRDPRWGRMSEGNGEDPYLGAEIARAMVKGYQGDDLAANNTMMACVKHFALYGAPDAGRDYNTVDMSRWRMFNYYMPAYKAAIEAGAGSVMTSFNVVEGVPASGNRWLMTEVLRDMWKFDGFVVTDYTAISEMIAHGMGDLQQVSALALNAGVDMDMVADGFLNTLVQSVNEGKVSVKDIDTACRRILEAKYKLGLFHNPYQYCDLKRAKKEKYTAENRAVARNIAAQSFVLLKNEAQLLPLKKTGKIALVGPMAHTRANMPGTWSVAATFDRYQSLYESMQAAVGNKAQITYAKGSNLMYDAALEARSTMFGREMRDSRSDKEMLDEALRVAQDADVIVVAVGEASEMSGESSSRSNLDMPDAQRDLLTALKKTGKPIVLVYFAGRATVMTWEAENFPAILNVGFGGSEAGPAICDVLFGDKVPSGKLTVTMPKNVGQIPLFYNHLPTGRPLTGGWFTKFQTNYLDVDNEPLYPFGYGLSYTTFAYGKPTLSSTTLNRSGGELKLSVNVTNIGNYDADEIVQMYVRDLVGSVSRPVKELKGFERVNLKRGETKTVTFTITPEDLKFYNQALEYKSEPGEFEVMVGPNSRDLQKLSFTLQ